jgi:hypothetical protein
MRSEPLKSADKPNFPQDRPAGVRLSNMTACVQVFGRRDAETIRALLCPASKKRQGTKSRDAYVESPPVVPSNSPSEVGGSTCLP